MTRSDMSGLVSQRLNEAQAPIFYSQAEIVAALNEANRFFVLLTLGLEKTSAWNVPAATTFFRMLSYFPDWIVPLRITTTGGAKVRPARLEDLNSLDPGWTSAAGAPERYCYLGCDFVGLYKQAAGVVTLNVTYARAPVALAADNDVPEIPAEYHPKLVDYAIYRMRQVEGAQELEKAMKYFDSFFSGAQHYAAYVRSRNLGSRYDKVPLELTLADRSRLLKLRPGGGSNSSM